MKRTILFLVALALCLLSPVADAGLVGGGSGFATGRLEPNHAALSEMDLKGGEWTTIQVTGHGDGDVNCYLYKGKYNDANLITEDTSKTNGCKLRVKPNEGNVHVTLAVLNVGPKAEAYDIVIP